MYDYAIIGAGPSGLCAAKTILECDPYARVGIWDSSATIGGVWAKERIYPTLKTNNKRGGIDFTDHALDDRFGVGEDEHVKGQAMHDYLNAYAVKHDLLRRITFNTKVLQASRTEDGGQWLLTVDNASEKDIRAAKLIVATSVTNRPHRPYLHGIDEYEAPILHSSEMGMGTHTLTSDSSIRTVTVLGGGKSAYDAVYLAATNGHAVDWVIRKSGKGPVWVFPTHTYIGPFRTWREKLVLSRFVSLFSPCLWQDGFPWIRDFLHQWQLGKMVTRAFWAKIGQSTLDDCGYAKDARLNTLEPETNPFFYGTASGTLSYSTDFFDLVRDGNVRVHREDISHLSHKTVHLANGISLPSDALITATGYSSKPTVDFLPHTSHSVLGIPTTHLTKPQEYFWADLDLQANSEIAAQFPRLLQGPFLSPFSSTKRQYNPGHDSEAKQTPWRLYRGIAPPGLAAQNDRSLVFVGMFSNHANTIRLELQCLWAYAYLNHRLDIDVSDAGRKVWRETALMQRYCEVRAPFGHGRFYPDLVFDQLRYFDLLMRDLGLRTWRKGTWWKELSRPYGQEDYRGVVREWLDVDGRLEDAGREKEPLLRTSGKGSP